MRRGVEPIVDHIGHLIVVERPGEVFAVIERVDRTALKRSLAQEPSAPEQRTAKSKRAKQTPDRRQPALLLPLTGDRKTKQRASAEPTVTSSKKRSRGA